MSRTPLSSLVGLSALILLVPACGDNREDGRADEIGIDEGLTLDDGPETGTSVGDDDADDDETGPKLDMDSSDAMGNGGDCPATPSSSTSTPSSKFATTTSGSIRSGTCLPHALRRNKNGERGLLSPLDLAWAV